MTAALLPPAGMGCGFLPAQVLFQTAPGPATRVTLTPAGTGMAGVPAQVPAAPVAALPPAGSGSGMLPALILFALPPPPGQPQPAWQRDVEGWAVARERLNHVQALWQYGELAIFALLWSPLDLTAGLVQRCYRCWQGDEDSTLLQIAEAAIAAAYGQGNQYACPVCYNTTLALPEGSSAAPGLRALLVRPAMWTEVDRAQSRQAKGVMQSSSPSIESTPDFRVRNGDYAFRSDGTRFSLKVPRRVTLRTGFATPWQAAAAITYNMMSAALEDPATVAYQVPPGAAVVAQILGTYTRVPAGYGWAEIINGPLIPGEAPPPAASGAPQPPVTFPIPGGAL